MPSSAHLAVHTPAPATVCSLLGKGVTMGPRSGDAELERLVVEAVDGDDGAWQALWRALEPRLSALLTRRTFVAYGGRAEDARDVLVAIMARLRENDFQRLKVYLQARRADPQLGFMRWLIVLARRVAIDSMRAHP